MQNLKTGVSATTMAVALELATRTLTLLEQRGVVNNIDIGQEAPSSARNSGHRFLSALLVSLKEKQNV